MTQATFNFAAGEILNINKPEGWTSFDVVKKIRSAARIKKVGHAGTLDPFASGVLLLCTGPATKQVESLMAFDKEYVAEIELGKTTDTYDRTGLILSQTAADNIDLDAVINSLKKFEGEIYQTPPMYSAIKVRGQRLYELARRGEAIERTPRKIRIYGIELINHVKSRITIKVVCTKGTYIRSLAHDLGEDLGCGAYLHALVRTRVGSYRIEDAWSMDLLVKQIHSEVVR